MVRLATVVGPFLLAAFAAEAFPLTALQSINVRSLAGLGIDAIEDGAKLFEKDGSKVAPSLAKDAHAAAPAAGAAKAGSGAVSSIEKDVGKKAAKAAKSNSKPSPEQIEVLRATKKTKSPEQLEEDKAKAKANKEAAAAKAKADSEEKAARHNAKADSKKLKVQAPANKDDIPANTKCNSNEGENNHSQAAVLAAQQRGVQLLTKGVTIAGFPHEFTGSKGEGIDDVDVPAACKGQQLFEFPILKTASVFDVGDTDPVTDRVLFTHNAAGQNINCGLITHDTKDKVKNKKGELVQRFVSCK